MGERSFRHQGFRKLEVWQHADDLVFWVFQFTDSLSRRNANIAYQIERSSLSVPSNISEGYGRLSRREYLHHLSIARGSLAETEYLLHCLHRLGALSDERYESLSEISFIAGNKLLALIKALAAHLPHDAKGSSYKIGEERFPYGEESLQDD